MLHDLCRSGILVSGLQKWLETVDPSESFLHTTDWIWLPAEEKKPGGREEDPEDPEARALSQAAGISSTALLRVGKWWGTH